MQRNPIKKVQLISKSTPKCNRDLVVVLECIAASRLVAPAYVITEKKLVDESGTYFKILKDLVST